MGWSSAAQLLLVWLNTIDITTTTTFILLKFLLLLQQQVLPCAASDGGGSQASLLQEATRPRPARGFPAKSSASHSQSLTVPTCPASSQDSDGYFTELDLGIESYQTDIRITLILIFTLTLLEF